MSRKYTHIKEYEEEIFKMKEEGKQTMRLLNITDSKIGMWSRD